ncbi:MAG: 50S ribosomal protein L29 [Deltaproteobacteria bacterium]|nr:50S ribosomal protein L29 [Deltaproteobacteria bacterium]
MKPNEIRETPVDELKVKETELKKELFNLRMRHSTSQIENPLKIRALRRDIARVKTVIAEKTRGVKNG